jgi:hypothetical protein
VMRKGTRGVAALSLKDGSNALREASPLVALPLAVSGYQDAIWKMVEHMSQREELTWAFGPIFNSHLDPRASVDGATRSINRARQPPPEVKRDRDGDRLRGIRSYRGRTARWVSGR